MGLGFTPGLHSRSFWGLPSTKRTYFGAYGLAAGLWTAEGHKPDLKPQTKPTTRSPINPKLDPQP